MLNDIQTANCVACSCYVFHTLINVSMLSHRSSYCLADWYVNMHLSIILAGFISHVWFVTHISTRKIHSHEVALSCRTSVTHGLLFLTKLRFAHNVYCFELLDNFLNFKPVRRLDNHFTKNNNRNIQQTNVRTGNLRFKCKDQSSMIFFFLIWLFVVGALWLQWSCTARLNKNSVSKQY